MKKLLFLIAVLFLSVSSCYCQNNNLGFSFGAGVSVFSEDAKESSNVGAYLSFSINKVYFSIASNFAKGKGEELDYSSSETYNSNKVVLGLLNFGYIFEINKFNIIPVLGYGWSREIYEDPIAFDTYFYGDSETHFNAGVKGRYLI